MKILKSVHRVEALTERRRMRYMAFGLVVLLAAVGQADAMSWLTRSGQSKARRQDKIQQIQGEIATLRQDDTRTDAQNDRLEMLEAKLARKLSKSQPRKRASWGDVRNYFRKSARGLKDSARASIVAGKNAVQQRVQDAQDQVQGVVVNAHDTIAAAQERVVMAAQEAQENALAVNALAQEQVQGAVAAGLEKIAQAQQHAVAVADAAQQITLEQAQHATEAIAGAVETTQPEPLLATDDQYLAVEEAPLACGTVSNECVPTKITAKKMGRHGKGRKGVGHRTMMKKASGQKKMRAGKPVTQKTIKRVLKKAAKKGAANNKRKVAQRRAAHNNNG